VGGSWRKEDGRELEVIEIVRVTVETISAMRLQIRKEQSKIHSTTTSKQTLLFVG